MYVIAFRKSGLPARPAAASVGHDERHYVNPCCTGGDLIIARVLPALAERSARIEHGQEDWGWYAWSHSGSCRLAVHAQCDDVETGEMRVLVSVHERGPWWTLFREREIEGPQLEALRDLTLAALEGWTEGPPTVEHQRATV